MNWHRKWQNEGAERREGRNGILDEGCVLVEGGWKDDDMEDVTTMGWFGRGKWWRLNVQS